ncbi:CoA pyrophosphatase [Halorutilales archaeon Cl-col2-1]
MSGLKEVLRNRSSSRIHDEKLKRSAVVVPAYYDDERGGHGVLLTRRSDDLPRHAGQISFPGGRMESDDTDLAETALRELHEEVGMPPEKVDLLGTLDDVTTTTAYSIRPYVGCISYPYSFEVQESEVAELIHAPVSDLTHPSVYEKRYKNGRDVHYFHYEDYTIWGATARILAQFLELAYDWSP